MYMNSRLQKNDQLYKWENIEEKNKPMIDMGFFIRTLNYKNLRLIAIKPLSKIVKLTGNVNPLRL